MCMSPRELWVGAGKMQAIDRIPFFPKLSESYVVRNGGSLEEHNSFVGADRILPIKSCVTEHKSHCDAQTEQKGNVTFTTFHTPVGSASKEVTYDADSASYHPTRMPIHDLQTLRVMTRWFEDSDFTPSGAEPPAETYWASRESAGTSPLMVFLEELAGIEEGNYILADYPKETEEFFCVLHERLMKKSALMAEHTRADFLFYMENTSTSYISPGQFERHCVPRLNEYAGVFKRAGREDVNVVFHMCGHLKTLLPVLSTLGCDSYEAVTSPPVGDTPLGLARAQMPDKCLIGGTSATLWMEPAKDIIGEIERTLDALPHHRGLILSSAGQMPAACLPQTVKEVGDWLRSYKPRF